MIFRELLIAVMLSGLLTCRATAAPAQVEVGGAKIKMVFISEPDEVLRKLLLDWVFNSARAVSLYYESFPVSRAEIRISLHDGADARSGKAFGWNGALIGISAGRASTAADFADDWLLTHEMLHFGFPSFGTEGQRSQTSSVCRSSYTIKTRRTPHEPLI